MHTCQNYKNKHKIEEFIQWPKKHSSVCYVNHKESSDSMESQGACEIPYFFGQLKNIISNILSLLEMGTQEHLLK